MALNYKGVVDQRSNQIRSRGISLLVFFEKSPSHGGKEFDPEIREWKKMFKLVAIPRFGRKKISLSMKS